MAGHSYTYYENMARRPDVVHGVVSTCRDEDDGSARIHVWGSNTWLCPGVAIRFHAVIDCTPVKDPTPPLTIEFVKNEPDGSGGSNPQPTLISGFTRDLGDFILIRRAWDFEATVAAAGFPPECSPIVEDFCLLSATKATNSFRRSMAITVEMGPPGGHIDDDHRSDDEVGEECPICTALVVGSAETVKLSCSHSFHRTCLDKWLSRKCTCPYCRSRRCQKESRSSSTTTPTPTKRTIPASTPCSMVPADGETWTPELRLRVVLTLTS